MAPVTSLAQPRSRGLLLWYGLAIVLAVFTYVFSLDSEHIPKNGDEYPYEHITRMTAASGRWLPLQSDVPEMRNTKPPLLFWQGIASTEWGRNWSLWNLRWPSVAYTMLTGVMVLFLAWKLSGQLETGFVALLTFLAFFSTYRYGRPFLTDPPSVFWLFAPCAIVVGLPRGAQSRVGVPLALGLVTGVALLYKSFALLLPVALWLCWWYLREREYRLDTFLMRDIGKLAITSIVALSIFSLWFLLDPNPTAIVNEFVLKENAAKLGAPADYVKNFFWGGSSVWRLIVSYPLNAGFLMFPVVGLFVVAFRQRASLTQGQRLLWMWVITLFIVFCIPSQRDERYLLPAMPALAVLSALSWEEISGGVFKASLVATGIAVLLLAYLSVRLEQGTPDDQLFPLLHWVLVSFTIIVIGASLLVPHLTRPGVNVAILLGLTCFAAFLRPFDGAAGTYSASVQALMRNRTVWVPINFVAKEEGHRFLLPGAELRGYPYDPNQTADDLAARYPLFAMSLPMNATAVTAGEVLGQRLDIRTRHNTDEILDMLRGRVYENLFVKEVLIETASRLPSTANETRQ